MNLKIHKERICDDVYHVIIYKDNINDEENIIAEAKQIIVDDMKFVEIYYCLIENQRQKIINSLSK